MPAGRQSRRPGRTAKISISLDARDVAALHRLARRYHNGNVSAVLAAGVRLLREQEGRRALVRWLGDAGRATVREREAIRAQWGGSPTPRRRSRRAA